MTMNKLLDLHGKILIADDEKVTVNFFQVMLTKLGFSVEVAYDGEEVLEKVVQFTPDLILLDLLMPKLSGYKVVEILKQDEKTKNIPIIVLTAVSDIKDKVDMIELGIEDYITKPFNFVEILARIRSNLRSKFLRDEVESKERNLRFMNDLERSIKGFLEQSNICTEEIKGSLDEIKTESFGKNSFIHQINEAVSRLLKEIEKIKKAYESYNKKVSKRGNYAE